MTGKPKALVRLDDTVTHLRNTLRKHKDKVPPSLTTTICGLISGWGRAVHKGATAIAPGREKIAQWGGCADRQAGYNLAVLRNWKFLKEVDHGQGGRGRKTVYSLNFVALIDALRLSGVKLHPTLVDKLSQIGKWAAKGSRKGGNGCSLCLGKPLTQLDNNVAAYTYIGEIVRVTRTSLPVDRLEQEAS